MNNPSFKDLVYSAVRQIPVGQTVSYSDIAKMIGKPQAARAVGTALHFVPTERYH